MEFALILPLFLLLLVGLFDLGRAVFAYHTVSNAAREAGRLAIVNQAVTDVQDHAAKHAVALGIDPLEVEVTYLNPDGTVPVASQECFAVPYPPGCVVEVTVPYQYSAATPIIGNLIGPLNIASTTRMQVEFTNPNP